MTLDKVLDLAVPYVEDDSKDELRRLISKFPEFKKEFDRQMTTKYESDIENKGIFFVINDNSQKGRCSTLSSRLRLGYVGKERFPLLSIDIY